MIVEEYSIHFYTKNDSNIDVVEKHLLHSRLSELTKLDIGYRIFDSKRNKGDRFFIIEHTFSDNLMGVLDSINKNKSRIKSLGVDEILLDLAVYYDGQCNLSFSPDEMKLISEIGMVFNVSCYNFLIEDETNK